MADTFKGIITADGKKRQLPYNAVVETPVSDKTLSIQGAFADAKVVGDKFKEVKAETGSLKKDLGNLSSSKISKFYATNNGENHLADSDDGKMADMKLYGRSEQKQYSGRNLFDKESKYSNIDLGRYWDNVNRSIVGQNVLNLLDKEGTDVRRFYVYPIKANSKYTLFFHGNITNNMYIGLANASGIGTKDIKVFEDVLNKNIGITTSENETYLVLNTDGTADVMLELGTEATSYEPYTGRRPSPSPDYPQEIKSVVNPTVKVCGGNILDIKDVVETVDKENGVTYSVQKGILKIKGTPTSEIEIRINFLHDDKKLITNNVYIFNPNPTKSAETSTCYLDFTNNTNLGISFLSGNINKPVNISEAQALYPFVLFVRFKKDIPVDMEWKPQLLLSNTLLPYQPYTEQAVALPYTLNAIPVSSGGNVTIDGQQYVSDYVDVERGKLVRMVGVTDQDAFATSEWSSTGAIEIYSQIPNVSNKNAIVTISSKFASDWAAGDEIHHFTQLMGQTLVMILPKTITTVEQGEEIRAKGFKFYYILKTPIETDLTPEEIAAFKALATYYPVTNISANSEQLDGLTVFNYPISMANGWNYVKQQLNDNRDYIYDMDAKTQDIDTQSAEAYVNSEYAVALTELEV